MPRFAMNDGPPPFGSPNPSMGSLSFSSGRTPPPAFGMGFQSSSSSSTAAASTPTSRPSPSTASSATAAVPGANDNFYSTGSSSSSSETPMTSDQSVKLVCQNSSDGRSIHSLTFNPATGSCFIESQSLPLVGTYEREVADATKDNNDDVDDNMNQIPSTIRTNLPQNVFEALKRYPPKELFCLGKSNMASSHHPTTRQQRGSGGSGSVNRTPKLPPLCLYTAKDVFILHLDYETRQSNSSFNADEIVEGKCVRVDEPYQDYLMGRISLQIIRVRSAPQQSNGYSNIMCPPSSIAMLIVDTSSREYALCLFHGYSREYTYSLQSADGVGVGNITEKFFPMEDLDDDKIVDFCFCQCGSTVGEKRNNLQLLSYLTVALLKSSGVTLHAGPVLFRKAVVPKATFVEAVEFLDASMEDAHPSSARRRQCMTAKMYLMEAFPDAKIDSKGTSFGFVTAKTGQSVSFDWPIKMQFLCQSDVQFNEDRALSSSAAVIEPFSAGSLSGFAIGYDNDMVDFCVASPSMFIPRFAYESHEDSDELDENPQWGACANSVDLQDSNTSGNEYMSASQRLSKLDQIQLIRDPVMDTVVHYVTPKRVVSISTTAPRQVANKAHHSAVQASSGGSNQNPLFSPTSKRGDLPPKTTAWMTLDVAFFQGSSNPIVGAVVSSNVKLGHAMIVRLADGKTTAINLTETRHRQEIESMNELDSSQVKLLTNESSVASIDPKLKYSKPLTEVIKPNVDKVLHGLSRMAKIGGTSTPQSKITVDILAGVHAVHQRCKEDVYLPANEVYAEVSMRRKDLMATVKGYEEQLQNLQSLVIKLKERQQELQEKASIIKENATYLASRCSEALQASTDLLPTLTQTEYDYFLELKRMEERSKDFETQAGIVKVRSLSLKEATEVQDRSVDPFSENRNVLDNTKKVLKGTELKLSQNKSKLTTLKQGFEELADIAGIDTSQQ